MRVGISLASFHPVEDPRDGVRRMVARARVAEQAGLDSLFVGDHHVTPLPYYQNSPILGRLLAEWGDRPCGALYLLPLWHPVLLAEQIGTLASVARGRFILQCAIGPSDRQSEAMGVNPRHRPSRFEEALDVIRRLLAGEEVESDGRYRFRRARISPVTPEPLEVWIGASAPPAIDRAARLGEGWIASPHLTVVEAESQIALYRERCEAHGRSVGVTAIRRDVFVGADEAEVEAVRGEAVGSGHRGFPEEALVIGTVADVSERLLSLAELGYSDVLVRNLARDPGRALESTARLSEVRAALLR